MGRRLGQHFLADPAVADRIVAAIEPHRGDVVIEVGPGRGALTRRLAPRVGWVVAIEKDRALATALDKGMVEAGPLPMNVDVVAADALRCDWPALIRETPLRRAGWPGPATGAGAFKVIGNIPYYVTSPLIEKALSPPLPAVVVFLLQREVADRLAAPPGSRTYGALSAGVQAVAAVERLFLVRRGAFRPPPKVDSAVVRLRPLADPLIRPEEQPAFRRFLAGLFSQRRKQLGRSLRTLGRRSKHEVERLLGSVGLDPDLRPEQVGPSQLVRLFRAHGS